MNLKRALQIASKCIAKEKRKHRHYLEMRRHGIRSAVRGAMRYEEYAEAIKCIENLMEEARIEDEAPIIWVKLEEVEELQKALVNQISACTVISVMKMDAHRLNADAPAMSVSKILREKAEQH